MNLSQSSSIVKEANNHCNSFFYKTVPLRYFSLDSVYRLLISAAVLNFATCPCTIFFNALVLMAVKTKRRLQKNSIMLLAFLAITDLLVGLVVQPLHGTITIFLLQGKDLNDEFCDVDLAFTVSGVILTAVSLLHLVLISGERFLTIKNCFTQSLVLTKTHVIMSSIIAWIAGLIFLPMALLVAPSAVTIVGIVLVVMTVVLQALVYNVAQRHEKHILSTQEVSLQMKAKFKMEKKALELTTIIVVTVVVITLLLPLLTIGATHIFGEGLPEVKTTVLVTSRQLSLLVANLNSFLNPVIFIVRQRQLRIAIIELLLRKSFHKAREMDRKLFGLRNVSALAGGEANQEGEGRELQNAQERCPVQDEAQQDPDAIAPV